MPSFFQSGRFHGVVYITAPSHVCLQVAFAPAPVPEPELVPFPAAGTCSHGTLDPERIRVAVVEASARTNHELGTSFSPAAIGYVLDDSPRYELFGHCAALLVRRLAGGEPFPVASSDGPPLPNKALQRTEAGGGVGSEFQP